MPVRAGTARFARLLGKIEQGLDLVQTSEQADARKLTESLSFRGCVASNPESQIPVCILDHPGMTTSYPAAHFAAVTTISTMCGGSRSTPMQARIGGFSGSTHSSQARFISPFRSMSAM